MISGLFGVPPGLLEPPSEEKRRTLLAGQVVDYTLKRSGKRRTIGLRIDDGGLTVSVPLRCSEKWLNSVLQDKAPWIVEKLGEWQSKKPVPVAWVDGEPIPFMGENLTLRVVPSLFAAPPLLRARQLFVHVTDISCHGMIGREVEQWYRREAEMLFRQRVAHYSPLLNVSPSKIRLSSARTQWGSCNVDGTVHLNWQLIKFAPRLIDYVVVHELSHLVEMNHSDAFWRVVKSACPDFRRRRAELRQLASAI